MARTAGLRCGASTMCVPQGIWLSLAHGSSRAAALQCGGRLAGAGPRANDGCPRSGVSRAQGRRRVTDLFTDNGHDPEFSRVTADETATPCEAK